MRWWLVLLLASIAVPGWADTARAEAPRETREILVEDERLRRAEIFEDTAVETEVIEQREIEALPATDAATIVETMPGIRTQARVQGEDAAVSIEGMPPEYTKIQVDGQRYSGEIGGVDDLSDVPTLNARRIVVRRGPQALREGSDAAGGVIDIESRRAPDEGYASRIEGGGGNDEKWYGAAHGAGRIGPVGLTGTYVHDQIAGFSPPEGSGNAGADGGDGGNGVNAGLTGKDSIRRSNDVYGTVVWDALPTLTLEGRGGFRHQHETFVPDDVPDSDAERDISRWLGTVEATWWPLETTSVGTELTYYTRTTDSQVARIFTLDESEWKLDAAVDHFFTTGPVTHAITAGADLRWPSLVLDEADLPPLLLGLDISAGDVDEDFREYGFFLVTESSWSDWASVELGLRYQGHSEFDPEIVPQVALLVKPHASLKVRISWGQNHRNPSLRDLYQPETPQFGGAYFLAGNPNLEPESSEGWRAGFEWRAASWLSVSATGFHNDIDDSIRSVLDRAIGVPTGELEEVQEPPPARLLGLKRICEAVGFIFPDCAAVAGLGDTVTSLRPGVRSANLFRKVNLDSVRTRGVEAQIRLQPHRRVMLNIAYTLLDTEVRDSDRPDLTVLPNTPKHQFDWRFIFSVPVTETEIAFIGQWRDETVTETSGTGLLGFSNPAVLSDPSLILSTRLTQPITDRIEVFFDANNLTDERVRDSYVIRGRTFFVGVRVRLGVEAREEVPSWWRDSTSI